MKAKAKPEAQLSWPQVHAFRLQRQHLAGRAPKKDLAKVVGEIGGAQAQLMSAAELQIAVRVDCTVADVRKALWTDRTLVKTEGCSNRPLATANCASVPTGDRA